MSPVNILDGYVEADALCKGIPGRDGKPISRRTLQRYEEQPDGLPSLTIGGRKYYRVEAVLAWLKRRERVPNPTRRKVA